MAYTKEQMRIYQKEWRKNNPEKKKEYDAKLRSKAERKEYMDKYSAEYRKTGKAKAATKRYKATEKGKLMHKQWLTKNPDKVVALSAKRRSAKLNRTPEWVDMEEIKDIYIEANYQGMHVDHIIPLQGELVSGLHVTNNLQLLTEFENLSKGNKYIP